MKVLFFGKLRDITLVSEIEIDLQDSMDISKVNEMIFQKFPLLQAEKFTVAVNQKIANPKAMVYPSDTIALLPPFSGG